MRQSVIHCDICGEECTGSNSSGFQTKEFGHQMVRDPRNWPKIELHIGNMWGDNNRPLDMCFECCRMVQQAMNDAICILRGSHET
jgi:hypothetical protein